MTSVGIMASAVNVAAGPCTLLLTDSFDHFGAWAQSGSPARVAGRNGYAAQMTGTDYIQHTMTTPSDTVTFGFAYRRTDALTAVHDILRLYTAGFAHEATLKVDPTTNTLTWLTGASTVIGTSASGVVAASTWAFIEVQLTMHNTTGAVTVRVNGTTVITATGADTMVAGPTIGLLRLTGFLASGVAEYDDLYLSVGTGCTFQGDQPAPASPQTFKTSLGQAVAEGTAATTIVITTTAAIAVGDLIVVRAATDNSGAFVPTMTCADSGGNTYITYRGTAGSSSAGTSAAGAIMIARATAAIAAGGTITVTLSAAVAARVAYAESFTGFTNGARMSNISGGSGTAMASPGSSTVGAGELVLGFGAAETRTAPTAGDTDTVGSAWSTLVAIPNTASGTDNLAVMALGQHKIAVGTASQVWNATLAATTDWVAGIAVMGKATGPPTEEALTLAATDISYPDYTFAVRVQFTVAGVVAKARFRRGAASDQNHAYTIRAWNDSTGAEYTKTAAINTTNDTAAEYEGTFLTPLPVTAGMIIRFALCGSAGSQVIPYKLTHTFTPTTNLSVLGYTQGPSSSPTGAFPNTSSTDAVMLTPVFTT